MNDQSAQVSGRYPYAQQLVQVVPYGAAALLSLVILFWVTNLWQADFTVLFTYYVGGDLFWNAATIKGLLENGSYLVNPNLGAPFGLQVSDYPVSEALHFLLLRLLGIFTGNAATTLNVFYILSYPITTLSTLWVFRRFDVGTIPSVICSLLYTFLITHFVRGQHHLTYSCYFLVPLFFWVVLTVSIPTDAHPTGGLRGVLRSRWFLGRLAVCIATASYGFYYSFFGMFFLFAGGLFAWATYKYRMGFLTSLALAGAMLVTSLCNVLPNIVFWAREGGNAAAVVRAPIAAETYGLKLTYMVLPNLGHRAHFLSEFKRIYLEQGGANEAATTAGLGLIGGLGLTLLLATSIFRYRSVFRNGLFDLLSALNLAGVLLSTVGGLGSILSFLGLKQIRAYNRISVFLAFLAFLSVGLVWRSVEKSIPSGWRPAFILASLLVAAFGLWDEIPGSVAPNYALSSAQWVNDASYVARLESSAPPGAMIFQLPYVPFPEHPPMVEMTDYSHLRPYLHSKHLRWSYGAIKGRKGAAWMEAASALPVSEMVRTVASAGYAGIYIDRFGYTDRAAALEAELAGLLKTTPIVSADSRLCYFSLGALARKSPAPAATVPDEVITTLESKWEGEFSILETNARENWRWCGNQGTLRFTNKLMDTVWVRLSATIKTAWPENAKTEIRGAGFADEFVTNASGYNWERLVAIPPGEHVVTFTSNARKHPVSGNGDPRALVFALHNFTLERVEPPVGGVAPKPLMQRPVELVWGAGAYSEEAGKIGVWHWCSAACEVALINPSTTPAKLRITMGVSTGHEKPARFTLKGPGISETVSVNSGVRPLTYTLSLPPGKSAVKMSSDAPRVHAPGDAREMVFMVRNVSISQVRGDVK